MQEFAKNYINFLGEFFRNIGKFFKGIGTAFADAFFNDIVNYFKTYLFEGSGNFNFIDWLCAIVVVTINIAFVVFLFLRLFQLLRRYIRFSRREIEKDALLEEIALLNMKTAELVDEKSKIMAMKVSSLGLGNIVTNEYGDASQTEEAPKPKKALGDSRFTKLTAVDLEYETKIISSVMSPEDMVGLPELVERFINYSASQLHLYYTPKTIRTYFAGMATSKIIILEGISGTGKTSLPYAMGKFFNHDSAIISVQPSWRDRAEMIGYFNEFTKKFNETDFLKALYESNYRDDVNYIILDEMNLARIEYYFAEFLSIMEMPNVADWKIDIVPDQWANDPKLMQGGKILVPQNLWFVGTANRDDSTFTITDKVYDRAIPIEMNYRAAYIDAPFTDNVHMSYEYLANLFETGVENHQIDNKLLDKLLKLDEFVAEKFKITFGNRIMRQIKVFVPAFVACGGSELEALDYIIARKIFRKFESLNILFLKNEIIQLISLLDKLFGKNAFKECQEYLNGLLKTI